MTTSFYEPFQDTIGLTERQFQVVVAIMSHEQVFGMPVLRTRLSQFIGSDRTDTTLLESRRWIERTSDYPRAYRATKRAWRLLGVRQRNFCIVDEGAFCQP